VEASADPKESWFQLWLAMHYELKEYPQAALVLEEMVRRFPHQEKYWKQLSTIYLELKQDGKALSALELAHAQGFLRTENELVQLANMYMYQGIPHEAAEVLQSGLDKGIIAPTRKHWEALGNAYMEARENDKAIPALQKAADASDGGDIDLRVAYLYLEKEQWDKAADALSNAIRKGDLSDPGMAYLLLGMASYERKQYEDALKHFGQAQNFDKRKDQAAQWINHIQSELAAVN
jgi:tetratricopeptide (TPR) repeat protein